MYVVLRLLFFTLTYTNMDGLNRQAEHVLYIKTNLPVQLEPHY